MVRTLPTAAKRSTSSAFGKRDKLLAETNDLHEPVSCFLIGEIVAQSIRDGRWLEAVDLAVDLIDGGRGVGGKGLEDIPRSGVLR